MSKKPAALSASELAKLRATILKPPRGIVTDPIDMEHILQIDPGLGKLLTAQRLDTQADIHRAMADGAAKAARLLK
jgi:hypothetical protein